MKIIIPLLLILTSCAPPTSIEEFLGDGVKCKADVIMPEQRNEKVTLDIKIYNCTKI